MRTLRKIASFALAVLLVLSLTTAALADDESLSKTITITNLDQHDEVNAYRLFSYDEEYKTLAAAELFKTFLTSEKNVTGDAAEWLSEQANVAKVLEEFVSYKDFDRFASYSTVGVGSDGTAAFTLEPGYYIFLVKTRINNSKIYRPFSVFVKVAGNVSAVYGGGSDTALAEPVTLAAKGESGPIIDLMVREKGDTEWAYTTDAAPGETVEVRLAITLPAYTDVSDVYLRLQHYTDCMDSGPGFNHVYSDPDCTKYISSELDYKAIMGENPAAPKTVYLRVEMKGTGDDIGGWNGTEYGFDSKIDFCTGVYLEYGNEALLNLNQGWIKTDKKSVAVYSYGFALNKIDDAEEPVSLSGAKFTVYSDAACTQPISFSTVTANGTTYYYPNTSSSAVTVLDADLVIYGLDAGTYYVKEVETPQGYAAPSDAFKLVLASEADEHMGITGHLDAAGTSLTAVKPDEDGALVGAISFDNDADVFTVSLKNSQVPSLPSTGGIGTLVFSIGGVAVMVLAVALLLRRRKQEN